MAREEADRDDLLREVTALVPRVELAITANAQEWASRPIVVGSRREGGLSIYFGPDPVYHFDDEGRLRRGFVAGQLYRSQRTTLARLTRQRTEQQTELLRHDLEAVELESFLSEMRAWLSRLHSALVSGSVTVTRRIPEETTFVNEVESRLSQILTADPPLSPPLKK